MEAEKRPFEGWCVVELFGHHQIAGYVSEQTIGGCGFVRVDVPATDGVEPYTKLYGEKAIYAIHPCTENLAKQAAAQLGRHGAMLPVHVPDLTAAQDTIAEARRAAEWLRDQQRKIAAALHQVAEREMSGMIEASNSRPWQSKPQADYEFDDGDLPCEEPIDVAMRRVFREANDWFTEYARDVHEAFRGMMDSNQEERRTYDLPASGYRPRRNRAADVAASGVAAALQQEAVTADPAVVHQSLYGPPSAGMPIPWLFGIDGDSRFVPWPVRATQLSSGTIIVRIGCTDATLTQWRDAAFGGMNMTGYEIPPERRQQLVALLILIEKAFGGPDPREDAAAETGLPDIGGAYRGVSEAIPYPDAEKARVLYDIDRRVREMEERVGRTRP